MPKALHEALKKEANKKGYTGKRRAAYIFGVLNRWKKINKTK
jgi:hypothetical protein